MNLDVNLDLAGNKSPKILWTSAHSFLQTLGLVYKHLNSFNYKWRQIDGSWNLVLSSRVRDYLFCTYTHFSEKLAFLTSWYAHVRVRIRELEILVFEKICVRTKWIIPKEILQHAKLQHLGIASLKAVEKVLKREVKRKHIIITHVFSGSLTQSAFTCSKSTIKIREQCVRFVQIWQ